MHRQNGAILTSAALLGLCLLGASATAAPDSVVAAVKANNVATLAELSKSAPTAQQRSLATGVLLALHHDDAEAIAMLRPVTRSTATRIVRATAYLALSDVYIRDQRYHARYSAIHAAAKLSPKSVDLGYQHSMAFAHALAGVGPMRVVRETPGSLPITDEKEGMIRVPVRIDGRRLGQSLIRARTCLLSALPLRNALEFRCWVGRPVSVVRPSAGWQCGSVSLGGYRSATRYSRMSCSSCYPIPNWVSRPATGSTSSSACRS